MVGGLMNDMEMFAKTSWLIEVIADRHHNHIRF